MIHVTTKIDRADTALVDELGTFSAATIHEAQGRKGALDSDIKPIDCEHVVLRVRIHRCVPSP